MSSQNRNRAGYDQLHREVIGAGLCCACGTCVGVCPRKAIEFNYESEEPQLAGQCKPCGICYAACPGKDVPMPDLEKMLFSKAREDREDPFGIRTVQLKGYACDRETRQAAASGGVASALMIYALETGLIDGAVVASMSAKHPWRTEPVLATSRQQILDSTKSKYAIAPSNAALQEAATRGLSRLGAVGLPCHVHGLRKLQALGEPAKTVNRIKFSIGLFCGSNFSYRATEDLITKYTGVPLERVAKFEYRGGAESQDMQITTVDGDIRKIPRDAPGRTLTRMRRERCAVCLDLSAELADVSLGDIFLPLGPAIRLPKISAILVRTRAGEELIRGAEEAGYIKTSPLAQSAFPYNMAVELKRHITPYYLIERSRFGWPVPNFHYQPRLEPISPVNEKTAILEQIKEIPEVLEWLEQNPKYQDLMASLRSR